ncbi:lytic murein transglycosylase [Streptomyces sp. NPDC046805]|uniref:lytic transglycosylase domain-containing protein n=1 Tax=Streptomyces sp. NPDC046805 TaxID=3155134 RepID=UPI00340A9A3C
MKGHGRSGALGSAKGTAVAAVAMVALTASQGPGSVPAGASEPAREAGAPAEHAPSVSGDAPYRTDLPPLRTGQAQRNSAPGAQDSAPGVAASALPASVFAAYRRAEAELARSAPGCRLRWQLLAAIGQVESGQARGGRVTPDGTAVPSILGPRLTGGGFAVVRDSDGGAYDGDAVYDRAVGPMQFIPSTWARWGTDGNGDGRSDPDNVYDAALAAGRYLCAGSRDLSQPAEMDRAILGYNHSETYLRTVRAWYAYFLTGHRVVPDLPAGSAGGPTEPVRAHAPKPPRKPAVRGADTKASRRVPSPSTPPGSPGPSSPTPTPTPSPTVGAKVTLPPSVPVPEVSLTVPGGHVLGGSGPLTSNS